MVPCVPQSMEKKLERAITQSNTVVVRGEKRKEN
jgi:hypothetical protein